MQRGMESSRNCQGVITGQGGLTKSHISSLHLHAFCGSKAGAVGTLADLTLSVDKVVAPPGARASF